MSNVVFPRPDESKLSTHEKTVLKLIRSNPGRNVAIIISDTRLTLGEVSNAILSLFHVGLIRSDVSASRFYAMSMEE